MIMTDATLPAANPLTQTAEFRAHRSPHWAFFALNAASPGLALGWLMVHLLAARGWSGATMGLVSWLLYLVGLPWTLIGFWNAAVGFAISPADRRPGRFHQPCAARDAGR